MKGSCLEWFISRSLFTQSRSLEVPSPRSSLRNDCTHEYRTSGMEEGLHSPTRLNSDGVGTGLWWFQQTLALMNASCGTITSGQQKQISQETTNGSLFLAPAMRRMQTGGGGVSRETQIKACFLQTEPCIVAGEPPHWTPATSGEWVREGFQLSVSFLVTVTPL